MSQCLFPVAWSPVKCPNRRYTPEACSNRSRNPFLHRSLRMVAWQTARAALWISKTPYSSWPPTWVPPSLRRAAATSASSCDQTTRTKRMWVADLLLCNVSFMVGLHLLRSCLSWQLWIFKASRACMASFFAGCPLYGGFSLTRYHNEGEAMCCRGLEIEDDALLANQASNPFRPV